MGGSHSEVVDRIDAGLSGLRRPKPRAVWRCSDHGPALRRAVWLALVASLAAATAVPAQQSNRSGLMVQGFWRVNDPYDPRKGRLLTPAQAEASGQNFEFCNRERATVDVASLIREETNCDDEPLGTWAGHNVTAANLEGAPIFLFMATPFGEAYREVGVIAGANPTINDTSGWANALVTDDFRVLQTPEPTTDFQSIVDRGRYLNVIDLDSDTFDVQIDDDGQRRVVARSDAAFSDRPVDLVATAKRAGIFTKLLMAAEETGLLDELSAEGTYTVFAPTDDAFAALPEGTFEGLLQDRGALASVLRYHVVPGEVMSGDFANGMVASTVQGADLSITGSGSTATVGGARIVAPDIEASNGVIHIINSVIQPD